MSGLAVAQPNLIYSALPMAVAAIFLGFGVYVLLQKGISRVTVSFALLSLITCTWQIAWAVLFQVTNEAVAWGIIKSTYILIYFLPTALYLFISEVGGLKSERRWVALSMGAAAILSILDVTSNLLIEGNFRYFWGFYPKAGPLHALHIVQTVIVIGRALLVAYHLQKFASSDKRTRMWLCLIALFVYAFAAVDYLCNYGFEFYPPGALFVAVSLGLIMAAVTRHDLLDGIASAAAMADEVRQPLASIQSQADTLVQLLDKMHHSYNADPFLEGALNMDLQRVMALSQSIMRHVNKSTLAVDMLATAVQMIDIDPNTFGRHSMHSCVHEAISSYPFSRAEKDRVSVVVTEDFYFLGSRPLMIFVLFHLIKSAGPFTSVAASTRISISVSRGGPRNTLTFKVVGKVTTSDGIEDAGAEIASASQPESASAGLAFCRRAIESFRGRIHYYTTDGAYAIYAMEFPALVPVSPRQRRAAIL